MSKKSKICGVVTPLHDPYSTKAARVNSREFWRWGSDNCMPQLLSAISRCSTTHRRIINDKADYISGKGFAFDTSNPLLCSIVERVNSSGESLRQLINKVAFDKALFGNSFVEVVTNADHTLLSLYHQDATHCRIAKDSQHIILYHNWEQYNSKEAAVLPIYPLFEEQSDGTLRSIIHYKDYEPGFSHYGVPPYIAGLSVSAIAYKTDRWNISRLDNSFQPSGIMILDDTVDNEQDAERMIRSAETRFAGKPGQVMFIVKDGSENDNSRFVPLSVSNDGDWEALHEQATNDIVVAHSWFRSLSGLNYSSGFNAERILHEYEIALNTVILGEQAELLEPLVEVISKILSIDCSSLEFINRPPTRSKPIYMKVWEARKADGLEYDPQDPEQQYYLSEITKYNVTKIG